MSGRCCPFVATLRRLSGGGPEDLRLSAAASVVSRAGRRAKRVRSRYKVYTEPSEGATVAPGPGSGFRVIEHEYVFDETVSRRFVRRYHFSGAETIFPLAPCKTNLVPPDQAGGPRRRDTRKKKTHTLMERRLGDRGSKKVSKKKPTRFEKKFRKRECLKKKIYQNDTRRADEFLK
ncbi:unnamed protein product [Aphis gossypii]|uniref:Uncharacterized protein n=1 Tax=Aphis gossypii TaxID=80765 RepID=A0A9P0JF11_APHGO|nr:unnamed protein product [Aphis gossypii]